MVREWTQQDVADALKVSKSKLNKAQRGYLSLTDNEQAEMDRLFLECGGDFSRIPPTLGRGCVREPSHPDHPSNGRAAQAKVHGPYPAVNKDQMLDAIVVTGGLIDETTELLRNALNRPSLLKATVINWIQHYRLREEQRRAFHMWVEYAKGNMRRLMDDSNSMVAYLSSKYILDKIGPEIGFGEDKEEARRWLTEVFLQLGDWLAARLADQPELLSDIRLRLNSLIFDGKRKGEAINALVVGSSSTSTDKSAESG